MKKFLCLFLTAMLLVGTMIVPIGAAELDTTPPADSAIGDYVAPKFIGIQTKDNGDSTQDIRFVATVASTKGNLLGFDIYANGKTYNAEGSTVYTQINAGTKTFKASDKGVEALFVVVIEDVPTGLENIQFDARTYVKYGEENTKVRSYNTTFEMNGTTFTTTLTNPSPAWATKGGKGTADNPYVLTKENFDAFYTAGQSGYFSGVHISLESDVVVNDVADITTLNTSTGTVYTKPMSGVSSLGVFNGNNHTISGLYISTSDAHATLFNDVNNATVKNLRVTNSYFVANAGSKYAGSIAAYSTGGTIENCYSDATLKTTVSDTNSWVGGIAARTQGTGSKISNCVFAGSIDAGANGSAGGIVGRVYGTANATDVATFTNCLNIGSVKGAMAGGLVARINLTEGGAAKITNCINLSNKVGSGDDHHLVGNGPHNYSESGYTVTYIIQELASNGTTGPSAWGGTYKVVTLQAFLALDEAELPGWCIESGYVPCPIAGVKIVKGNTDYEWTVTLQ